MINKKRFDVLVFAGSYDRLVDRLNSEEELQEMAVAVLSREGHNGLAHFTVRCNILGLKYPLSNFC